MVRSIQIIQHSQYLLIHLRADCLDGIGIDCGPFVELLHMIGILVLVTIFGEHELRVELTIAPAIEAVLELTCALVL